MGLLNRGEAWLTKKTQVAGGVSVTYTRGAETIPLTAVVGAVKRTVEDDGKAKVLFGERCYLIAVADLAAFGEPRRGDRITEIIDGTELVFEVQDQGVSADEPAWRHSGTDRATWRIMTKRK